ncbi:putative entry exclusion protein TrbK-alt [Bradyrhizobium diversitatis]|uniref:Entry exclusion protein TrbK-alt n=1 Tax=Bradyrhizobium diversitatis TaxID=2755406 RepID=A0ABS0NUI8_9BRAD|nr:putative entry exclusion protein TrbK-alt [Bradyrhizobium diversitatis]MBH5384682.1 putative entry exclusion protein TrbK-alt [Bradyrhizobium diversitatis]
MTDLRAFKALSLLSTIGVLVATACTIQLRGGNDPAPQKAEQTTGTTSAELARCRSITADEAAGYHHCKEVWAESRRQFFGKKDGVTAPGHGESTAGLASVPKDQSRIPQGYPKPEASKP